MAAKAKVAFLYRPIIVSLWLRLWTRHSSL
uniref:Uncharacterized protein n=1 Tax=Anguilla anguilla TaxID=7936 RepID=A0A0E9SD19_ANGAN